MKQIIETTVGCDLGDKVSEICILWPDGGLERPKPVRTTVPAMRAFFTRPPVHVVIEVGPHSRWVADLLKELGHRVTVANPRRVKLIAASDSKSDRKDAELLARLGRADVKLLAPIQHRGQDAQADLAVAKSRDMLVRCRTRLVNFARGTVKGFGERFPNCSARAFHNKGRAHIPQQLKAVLDPIFRALDALDAEIKAQDRAVLRLVKKYPEVEVMAQPSGVGVLTALVYLLTLEDKGRFKKSRTAGAFLGLRPKKHGSGQNDPQLRISKAGDPFLRRLLVQSAHYILGPFGQDSDLRRWGLELTRRGAKNGKKRATVAVARKVAVLMHRLWVTGEVYQPIGYGKAA
jgi:transposase